MPVHFGGVDIVINNAGIQHVAPVEQFPVDKMNDIRHQSLQRLPHHLSTGTAHRGHVLDAGVIDHDIDAAEGAFGIARIIAFDPPDVAGRRR